ncbi:MAG: sigma-E processing peptidase SpoIIGA [Lachnospiraceae bacterium]|nr:sigma-E processing peptidase SpoIIGA [Lachnospiraceae bacterium]
MYREIYIDVVFATNLLMDFVLLRLTGLLFGIRAVWYRSLLGAVIGSLSSCLILIIPTDNPYPAAFALHILTAAVMAKTGCKVKSKSMLARATVTLYILAFLCGGFWDVISAGNSMALGTFLIFTGVSYLFFAVCVRGYRKWNQKGDAICRVLLKNRENTVTVKGFYDTGNLLTDPLTNKPVSIVEEQALMKLLPTAALNGGKNIEEAMGECDDPSWESLRPHFIVFRSVGEHEGVLPVITLEEMCIYRGEQIIYVYHPAIAISSASFHSRGRYQMILNGRIL